MAITKNPTIRKKSNILGVLIRQKRMEAYLTIKEMAALIGSTEKRVCNVEYNALREEIILRNICDVLKIEPHEMRYMRRIERLIVKCLELDNKELKEVHAIVGEYLYPPVDNNK